ncbi:MAG: single-stranded-DNA-specific exonuclease RecJ [Pelagibacteraceae bacterium]|nr:single-stranded-DNA-specific exonuclease RecJ [Pelagibacteraceae bacterium]
MSALSVSGKNWILKEFSSDYVDFLKSNYLLDEIVARLLSIRKIKKEDVKFFLNPSIKNILPNPFILKDMDKAIERTVSAIVKNEKVGIFGDYDVDGATSTAVLGQYFRSLNIKFEIHIPDRKTEGFGPNQKAFLDFINKKVSLIFTVDCGTLSFKPMSFAKSKNVDVIILDHHQSEISLPSAHSIVNPNRFDDRSELNYLCAAGVCFLFLIALNKRLRDQNWFKLNNFVEPDLIKILDLVSLGTVCDVVPLIGLNRAIVKQGLKILKKKKNLGLKTLIEQNDIGNNITAYHLGYVLGPRINAGGRVGKSSHGANLLLNGNPQEAFRLTIELNNYNKERQILETSLLNKIMNTNFENKSDPVIILHGEDWHEGIIGIIAARIKEKYNKPTIIISVTSGVGKGSARSIYDFDMGSTILGGVQAGLLVRGGGHKMAGGFTINMKKLDEFKKFVFKKFKTVNVNLNKKKIYLFDAEIAPSALNLDFYDKINLLSPFGSGNAEPRFLIQDVKVLNSKIVGEKHIKSLLLGSDSSTIKTISFNSTETDLSSYLLKKNTKNFNIVGKLSLNEWRGQKNVEFIIDDISVIK